MPESERVGTVRRAFTLFAALAFDELGQLLTPDVEWPDFRDGSILRGRQAVQAYWIQQFEVATPSVLLGQVFDLGQRVIATGYEQLYDHDGRPIGKPATGTFHFYFHGDLIRRMEHSRLEEISPEILDLFGRTNRADANEDGR